MKIKFPLFVLILIQTMLCFAQREVNAIDSPTFILPNGNSDQINQAAINQAVSVVNAVEESNNFVNLGNFSPDSNVALPFGILKTIGAVRYVIAMDSLKFKQQGAYFSAYAAIDFPGTTEKLAFRGSNIKFNPTGVVGGEQAKLYLASTHVIQINPTVRLRLKGNGQNWVEWDCNGFKAINLVGNFEFSKGKIKPDPTQTQDTIVTASFQIYTQNLHDFITTVNITPFTLDGLPNWGFKVTNAIVDMSELENSPYASFPVDYPLQNLPNPNAWTGFALQSLKIKLPREVSKTGNRTEINVSNMLIDHMGLSGLFQVNNLFYANEGSMSGWAFSIEELGVGFTTNRITSGHLKGKVNVPLMDSSQSLQYNANINYNTITKETNYSFVVNPTTNFSFNVFNANVSLNNNSSISVIVQNGSFKPSANLSGLISFNNAKFNSNGGQLMFQNLTILTEAPYITNGIFTIHNIVGGQTKVDNFPISINDITFGLNQGAPVLGFSVTLNFSDQSTSAIGVGTSILLKGKIETAQQTFSGDQSLTFVKPKFKFDRVIINGISINFQTGPFALTGTVIYKDDDPAYGTGFFGNIEMNLPSISPSPLYVSCCFGSMPNYKYFYLDAKVNVDISLGDIPIKLTRLIGGLYYHMSPNKTTEADYINLNKNFTGAAGNALVYTPTQNVSIGLKAGVSYECTLNQIPYNGDVIFEINFTNSGGLGTVSLSGDIYSVATINNRPTAPIKGKISMAFDTPNRTFDAVAQVLVNSYQVITGAGYLSLHMDPQVWYCCIGKPSAPSLISFAGLVNVPFYCMIGNSIEAPLPPPGPIAQLQNVSSFYGNRNAAQLQNAGGYCAGGKITSSLNRSFGFSFFNVTGSFNFDLGFDMMMTNYGANAHCAGNNDKVGMHGWLAEGSMYLSMNGGVTINGSYKFTNNCPQSYQTHALCGPGHCCCLGVTIGCIVNGGFSYNVFSAGVAAVIAAKGPKPVYFAGALNCNYDIMGHVSGNFNYDFSYGSNCTPVVN